MRPKMQCQALLGLAPFSIGLPIHNLAWKIHLYHAKEVASILSQKKGYQVMKGKPNDERA